MFNSQGPGIQINQLWNCSGESRNYGGRGRQKACKKYELLPFAVTFYLTYFSRGFTPSLILPPPLVTQLFHLHPPLIDQPSLYLPPRCPAACDVDDCDECPENLTECSRCREGKYLSLNTCKGKGPTTPAIYLTIAIVWSNHWVISCTVLIGCIQTYDWSNYCDYNARNGSYNHLCNHNSWINRRCSWTMRFKFFSICNPYRKLPCDLFAKFF